MILDLIQRPLIAISLLLVVVTLIYRQAPQGNFIWDDEFQIVDNTYINSSHNLSKIFTSDLGEGAGVQYYFYRPLQTLTYFLEFKLWGFNPAGYHVTNIILHALTSILMFFFIRILFKDGLLAIISALLFAVHPAHTEAVAYISGRSDILSGIFLLVALSCYIKAENESGVYWMFGVLAGFVLALLSRESSLILIGLIWLYHFSFKKKIQGSHFASLIAVALMYIIFRAVFSTHLIKPWPEISLSDRFLLIPAAYFQFFKIFIWPFDLHMEYAVPVLSWYSKEVLIGLGFLVMTGIILYKYRKNAFVTFALGWFVIGFLPVSNLYPLNAYFAEHWLYLPSIGLSLLIAYFFQRLNRGEIVILIAVLMFWGIRTFQQVGYWRDPVAFYQRTIKYNPQSHRLYYNLGNLYFKRGYPAEEIIRKYSKAIELKPDEVDYHYNLALAYMNQNNYHQAEIVLRKVLVLDRTYLKAYEDLKKILMDQNRGDEAELLLLQAKQAGIKDFTNLK